MKINVKDVDYGELIKLADKRHENPKRPGKFLATVIRMLAIPDMLATRFAFREIGMEKLDRYEPCLILMNHSSFIDLEIAYRLLYPRPLSIVTTADAFVGKNKLMRAIGCIPTNKFVNDITLVKDMMYALNELKSSVLMYPEASYSFDGTQTPLPDSIGKLVKMLNVPVVMIKTYGAFARDPLYNNLQVRKINVSADIKCVFTREEVKKYSVDGIKDIINNEFVYDSFRWQQEKKVRVDENFRADYLNRVLYKCPHCMKEGYMDGKGVFLRCNSCGKEYELTEYGKLKAVNGDTLFSHIPDWYRWERECVRKEIISGKYNLRADVDILVMVNTKSIYRVGTGVLRHNATGFSLTGCDGRINYTQSPLVSYSLYSDYNWYEIGDMISVGDKNMTYYCFPKNGADIVAKTRLATEELYKIKKKQISHTEYSEQTFE